MNIEAALGIAVISFVPVYVIVQAVALWRLRGRPRKMAAIPLIPMAVILAYTVFAYRAGSTLFPIVLIFTSPPAVLFLIVVILDARRTREPPR